MVIGSSPSREDEGLTRRIESLGGKGMMACQEMTEAYLEKLKASFDKLKPANFDATQAETEVDVVQQ
jgi:uncharacterized protein Yka (UPF0111/DUF47 family)